MQQFFNQMIPAKTAEHQREHRRAKQNDKHHRADLDGLAHNMAQNRHIEALVECRQDNRTDRAECCGLSRRCNTGQDRAQNSNNQKSRRQQGTKNFPPQAFRTFAFDQCRGCLGINQRLDNDPGDIKRNQQQSRNEGPCKQVHHRNRFGCPVANCTLCFGISALKNIAQKNQND